MATVGQAPDDDPVLGSDSTCTTGGKVVAGGTVSTTVVAGTVSGGAGGAEADSAVVDGAGTVVGAKVTVVVMPEESPETSTAELLDVVVLSPNWPLAFQPQHVSFPVLRSAHVWPFPVVIAVALVGRTETSTGVELTTPVPLSPLPSWPRLLLPQHFMPPDSSAQECALVESAVTPLRGFASLEEVRTSTGVSLFTPVPLEPFPNWPCVLSPQHLTPPLTRAQVWAAPPEMTVTPLRGLAPLDEASTSTGEELSTKPPLPSCPVELKPQHFTVPAASRAQVWLPPAETATAPVSPTTSTGEELVIRLPLPSCPLWL